MHDTPTNCAGCGRPSQSHDVAIDISEVDAIGLPTLAGVVCHRCWIGETEGHPAIEDLVGDESQLRAVLDISRMEPVATSLEDFNVG